MHTMYPRVSQRGGCFVIQDALEGDQRACLSQLKYSPAASSLLIVGTTRLGDGADFTVLAIHALNLLGRFSYMALCPILCF